MKQEVNTFTMRIEDWDFACCAVLPHALQHFELFNDHFTTNLWLVSQALLTLL